MKFTRYPKRDAIRDYFPLPNEIFSFGLSTGEIAVYAYLMYCEDRKTFQCHPSYKTIGNAVGMSKNTVKKYVDSLIEKQLITVEPTSVITQNGEKRNGNLRYTIRPIEDVVEYHYEQQMIRLECEMRCTFATMALEHGMDVKTLSATIGHVSSATTLDIYSHITDTMQRQAAVHIDRKIGGTDAQMPTAEPSARKDTAPIEFTPYKPKIRKPGTGCVTMINDHLYEGRYTPTNAYGKRESHNIYAKTREKCEEKLAEMIVQVKAQIKAEKDKMTG